MAVAIAGTELSTWPPKVILAVTGLTIGDVVRVYRVVAGERTVVRGADGVTVTDTAVTFVDAEAPFGTSLTWVAEVNGADAATTSPATSLTLDGAKVAIDDPITGLAVEVIVYAWPEKAFTRSATTTEVGGRTVAVLGEVGSATSTVELLTETEVARVQLVALLRTATQGIVHLRSAAPATYPDADAYLTILGWRSRRMSQDGTDARRFHALDVVEAAAWSAELVALAYTYGDWADAYTGLTYADAALDYATYLDAVTADIGAA